MSIHLPPFAAQKRIAEILSAYDDLIENNTRRIAILEEMARALYREWFVDFRFPGHEGARMVESAVRVVPVGWELASVSAVATLHRGRSYRGHELVAEGGLPFLNLKCIDREGGFRVDGLKRFNGPYKETQVAGTGDLIMAVTDMTQERRIVARAARVPNIGEPISVISMDLVKIEPREEVPAEYLYGMLRWSGFADEVKQHANGANVLHLHPSRISDFVFALAPPELRQKYAEVAAPIYEQADVLQRKNRNLQATVTAGSKLTQ